MAEAVSVTDQGFGQLRFGMPVPNAEAALRTSLAPPPGVDSLQCRMARWDGAPVGVSLMIEGGRVVRVDVDSGGVATAAGARVGDSATRIEELYAGRVSRSPHKYTSGQYLTVTPAADSNRIVFETDGERVVRYRAGVRPQVEYVERCG